MGGIPLGGVWGSGERAHIYIYIYLYIYIYGLYGLYMVLYGISMYILCIWGMHR